MKAHRAILVSRCDMMRAMLTGDFREAHSSVVSTYIWFCLVDHLHYFNKKFQILFPNVTEYTFHKLLCYLYMDEIPAISTEKCLNLLEFANRLCLPRLLNLVEYRVIEDLLLIAQADVSEAVRHCLHLLEPVKVNQLVSNWLLWLVDFNFLSDFLL